MKKETDYKAIADIANKRYEIIKPTILTKNSVCGNFKNQSTLAVKENIKNI